MKRLFLLALAAAGQYYSAYCFDTTDSKLERGKRIVNECLNALGGDRYLNLQDTVQIGRAYSFYHEQVSGRAIAKIYTHYLPNVSDTAHTLAVEEREYFGKHQESSILFQPNDAYDITYRGARPLPTDQFAKYKESTLRNIFYILRVRFNEPGMFFEYRAADVLNNRPVEIVDVTDAQNLTTTVYFDQTTKLPVRQMFYRRDPVTKEKDEETTDFSNYRDAGGGIQLPYDVNRERNGGRIYEMFSTSVQVNKGSPSERYQLPSAIKLLKPV